MDKREKLLEARKKSGDNRLKEGHNVVSRKSKWDQQGPGAGVSNIFSNYYPPRAGGVSKGLEFL